MKEGGRKQSLSSPCAACKLLRRRCSDDCLFAPYFPPNEPHKFASVHKVFGASNVGKMLLELPEYQRGDAASSMVYEADARLRDPVYGCVGAICRQQQQIEALRNQLALVQAELVQLRLRQAAANSRATTSSSNSGSPLSYALQHCEPSFDMDMAAEQVGFRESMWSCT